MQFNFTSYVLACPSLASTKVVIKKILIFLEINYSVFQDFFWYVMIFTSFAILSVLWKVIMKLATAPVGLLHAAKMFSACECWEKMKFLRFKHASNLGLTCCSGINNCSCTKKTEIASRKTGKYRQQYPKLQAIWYQTSGKFQAHCR